MCVCVCMYVKGLYISSSICTCWHCFHSFSTNGQQFVCSVAEYTFIGSSKVITRGNYLQHYSISLCHIIRYRRFLSFIAYTHVVGMYLSCLATDKRVDVERESRRNGEEWKDIEIASNSQRFCASKIHLMQLIWISALANKTALDHTHAHKCTHAPIANDPISAKAYFQAHTSMSNYQILLVAHTHTHMHKFGIRWQNACMRASERVWLDWIGWMDYLWVYLNILLAKSEKFR